MKMYTNCLILVSWFSINPGSPLKSAQLIVLMVLPSIIIIVILIIIVQLYSLNNLHVNDS